MKYLKVFSHVCAEDVEVNYRERPKAGSNKAATKSSGIESNKQSHFRSGTDYSRIHFLPFTRDDRGYAQHTPIYQSL